MTIMGRFDKLNLVYILICFDFPDTNRPKPQLIITVIFDITHIKGLELTHWQPCAYKSDEIDCTCTKLYNHGEHHYYYDE